MGRIQYAPSLGVEQNVTVVLLCNGNKIRQKSVIEDVSKKECCKNNNADFKIRLFPDYLEKEECDNNVTW